MTRRYLLLGLTVSAPWCSAQWNDADRQVLLSGLDRTAALVREETSGLTREQWNFREGAGRWSIAEIVEHLALQEDMYFREIYLLAQQPPPAPAQREREQVRSTDERILAYATDPERGQASWFLEPRGRWSDPQKAIDAFSRSRVHLTDFIKTTRADLRQHLTYRPYSGTQNLWSVRDLHQLMLTTIAHTERHVGQMRKVKAHSGYPPARLEITANERAYLRDHFRMTSRLLTDTVRGMSDAQLLFKPASNRWSIAQCIEHLARTEEYIVNLIRTGMAKPNAPLQTVFPSLTPGQTAPGQTPGSGAAIVRRMTRLDDGPTYLQMTDRTRVSTIPVEQRPPIEEVAPPDTIADPKKTIENFLRVRKVTLAYVESTKDDLRGRYAAAALYLFPEVQPVQDGYQWLLRMSAHTERHLMQIHEVQDSPNFPVR